MNTLGILQRIGWRVNNGALDTEYDPPCIVRLSSRPPSAILGRDSTPWPLPSSFTFVCRITDVRPEAPGDVEMVFVDEPPMGDNRIAAAFERARAANRCRAAGPSRRSPQRDSRSVQGWAAAPPRRSPGSSCTTRSPPPTGRARTHRLAVARDVHRRTSGQRGGGAAGRHRLRLPARGRPRPRQRVAMAGDRPLRRRDARRAGRDRLRAQRPAGVDPAEGRGLQPAARAPARARARDGPRTITFAKRCAIAGTRSVRSRLVPALSEGSRSSTPACSASAWQGRARRSSR